MTEIERKKHNHNKGYSWYKLQNKETSTTRMLLGL
jgi:hypothetical protein